MPTPSHSNAQGAPAAQQRGATLLIVDDAEAVRRSLAALFDAASPFDHVLTATDGLQAMAILHQQPVDVVLCDLHMKRCDGLRFLALKSACPEFDDVPVIMLTGDAEVEQMVQALELGAFDYVQKGAAPAELLARVQVHLRLKRTTDALKSERQKLAELTLQDGLTGLANRRKLDEVLQSELDRSSRYKRPMSLVMVDLDHFKQLNDQHGHQAGDHVLKQTGEILRAGVRKHDLVARYGGEELAVVMPETTVELAALVAERLRIALCTADIRWRGERLRATASFGVAGTGGQSSTTASELMRLADRAMYRSKRQGRNRVSLARPDSGPMDPDPSTRHCSGPL